MVEEEKRRSTYVHTYIHTSDMIIGCALKGLRAPGLSTKQVQWLKCCSVLGLQCLASTQLGVCPLFNLISGAHCPLPSKESMLSSWTDKKPFGVLGRLQAHETKESWLVLYRGYHLYTRQDTKRVTLFWRRKTIKIASFFLKFKKCCRWDEFCMTFFLLHTFFYFFVNGFFCFFLVKKRKSGTGVGNLGRGRKAWWTLWNWSPKIRVE